MGIFGSHNPARNRHMRIRNYIPILEWLPNYNKELFYPDLAAGLTVGVMLIPQGMAYAMLAGLPPVHGLYAATIPILVYALLGTSKQLAVGPVAMDSLVVMAGVGALAVAGTQDFLEMAILLALMEGGLLLLFGFLRLGFIVNFLSRPIISGFTSAAALIIAISQLKHLVGVKVTSGGKTHQVVVELLSQAQDWSMPTFALGAGGIVLILALKKWAKRIPGALVVVVLGIVITAGFALDSQGVKIVTNVPQGLPEFALPVWTWERVYALFPLALTLALVAFTEAISIAKVLEAKRGVQEVRPNQELIALGFANLLGSFFQGYSVTGGFSRSAVNQQAGAKTPMVLIISAGVIICTLLFLTPLFYYLPEAVLASIILVAVIGLFDWKEPQRLWKTEKKDLLMLLVTFFATLFLGIAEGIGVGVLLSLGMLIFRSVKPHMARLGKIKGTEYFRNVKRFEEAEEPEGLLIVRFDAQLYFANFAHFREKTRAWANSKPKLEVIIVDCTPVNDIDSTALYQLKSMITNYRAKDIEFFFSGVKGPVRDKLHRAGFTEVVGADHFFMNIRDAYKFYHEHSEHLHKYALQTFES